MKLTELLDKIGHEKNIGDCEVVHITNDSRQVKEGSAFVCIPGKSFDGHDYAKEALEKGASVIVVQRDLGLDRQVIVNNASRAYAMMSANFFSNPAKKLRLIGITGTNGKTTTSYLLKQVLEAEGYRVGVIGTNANIICGKELPSLLTTPEPFELQRLFSQMAEERCDFAIMEVSSQALEQERVAGCHFEVGVFTNLTQDHLDYHGTMENYRAAKRKLFEICDKAVINLDDPNALYMTEGLTCQVVSYSINTDASDYTAKNLRFHPGGVDFELVGSGVIGRVRLGLVGSFSVYNAMAAATCALALSVPFYNVISSLSAANGVKGRLEVVPTGRDFTVVIDYAHTPDGLEKLLRALKDTGPKRLVALFGCGGDRDAKKRPLMGSVTACIADFVVVTSDNPRTENPTAIINDILVGLEGTRTPYEVIEDRKKAIKYVIDNAQPGDVIVLAGKGHETYQIIGKEKLHFDEREVVAAALAGNLEV